MSAVERTRKCRTQRLMDSEINTLSPVEQWGAKVKVGQTVIINCPPAILLTSTIEEIKLEYGKRTFIIKGIDSYKGKFTYSRGRNSFHTSASFFDIYLQDQDWVFTFGEKSQIKCTKLICDACTQHLLPELSLIIFAYCFVPDAHPLGTFCMYCFTSHPSEICKN